jgi:hypothetical protein
MDVTSPALIDAGIQDARDPRIHEEKLERIEARGQDGQLPLPLWKK